jgi:outer membrane protein OmpU
MMKKILLATAAVCGLAAAAAAPAKASDLELGISGFFLGYGVYNNQDEAAGASNRSFDLRKETEIHFNGETTLDNGLTVGVVVETNMDRQDDNGNNTVEESYAYFSGGWGRVNIGEEDGAPFLLQVAAPSADENIDGIRPLINSFDLGVVTSTVGLTNDVLSYDHDATGYSNKLTYFTPVFNGFQAGVSYTPAVSEADQSNTAAITADNTANQFDDAIEAALRFEGSFEEIDLAIGAAYTDISREVNTAANDDRKVWNLGADFDWGPFGLGMSYMSDNNGIADRGDTETFVVGVDYVTGPYRFGASYLNLDTERNSGTTTAVDELELGRWTGGVTYEYGPGMSFRGTIAFIEGESATAGDDERDGYQVTLGTQINF